MSLEQEVQAEMLLKNRKDLVTFKTMERFYQRKMLLDKSDVFAKYLAQTQTNIKAAEEIIKFLEEIS